MKNSILKTIATGLLIVTFAGVTVDVRAQDKKAKAEEKAEAKSSKPHPMPFHAKIVSVDKTAKTVVMGKRTFVVTDKTKILKDGDKQATLDDAKVGEIASGSSLEVDGKLQLIKFHIGPKPEAKDKKADDKK